MIFCIDSNVAVWGIKKQATQGQESMIDRTQYFMKWVDDNHHQLMIPTVVLAEILLKEPPEKYSSFLDIISKSMIVADFDRRAATQFAQLVGSKFAELKKFAQENEIPREKMKIDHFIIATALVHGAKCIYTTDSGLMKFAADIIPTRGVPELPATPTLLF